MQLPVKTKNPEVFANSITADDLKKVLDYISEMLYTTYICGQFGLYFSLNDEQTLIYKVYGKNLAEKLGFNISDSFNEKSFVWARLNANNYNWGYKVWLNLSKKYFSVFKKQHDSYRFNDYFIVSKIFGEVKKK